MARTGRPSSYSRKIADEIAEIYALVDPRDGAIRYIGKARDAGARLKSHLRDARRRDTPVYRWINKLAALGLAPQVRVLRQCPASAWQAAEIDEIKAAKAAGHRLLNVAEGGDEPYCPTETRAANGRKNAAAIHSDPRRRRKWELLRALGQNLRQGYVSDATKELMRSRPDVFGSLLHLL
jgi:hypothetical protein